MKIKNITILSILSLILIIGCGEKDKIEDSTENEARKEITQTFNFTTMAGKPITIISNKNGWQFKGLENKVVLLNFFGTWCPPCIAEIPHLNNMRTKLEKDFEILAVDVGPRSGGINPKEEVEGFIFKYDVKYPTISGEQAKELFKTVSELNPTGSIPFMVLFNKEGKYVKNYIGIQPEEMLFNDISATIKMK